MLYVPNPAGPIFFNTEAPFGIATSGTHLYWASDRTTDDSVARMPAGGGQQTLYAPNIGSIVGSAATATSYVGGVNNLIFYADGNHISRISHNGPMAGAPTQFTAGSFVTHVVVDESDVFWMDGNGFDQFQKLAVDANVEDFTPIPLQPIPGLSGGFTVFQVVDLGLSLLVAARDLAADNAIIADVSKDPTVAARVLVDDATPGSNAAAHHVTADDTHVYFLVNTANANGLWRAPRLPSGEPPEELYRVGATVSPDGITVAGSYVLFTEFSSAQGRRLMQLEKP